MQCIFTKVCCFRICTVSCNTGYKFEGRSAGERITSLCDVTEGDWSVTDFPECVGKSIIFIVFVACQIVPFRRFSRILKIILGFLKKIQLKLFQKLFSCVRYS